MAQSRQVQGRDDRERDRERGPGGARRAELREPRADPREPRRGGPQGDLRAGHAPHVESDHDSHGKSPAAWTAVGLVMAGALVMAIAVVIATVWLFVVGAVLVVLGGVSGKVLSAMGFGVSRRPGH